MSLIIYYEEIQGRYEKICVYQLGAIRVISWITWTKNISGQGSEYVSLSVQPITILL